MFKIRLGENLYTVKFSYFLIEWFYILRFFRWTKTKVLNTFSFKLINGATLMICNIIQSSQKILNFKE